MENVIPVTLLIALAIFLATAIPNFTAVGNISDVSRQIGEFGLIVVGLTIVMLAGGIDLSVGSNFALANVTMLALINVARWPIEAAIAATIGVGACECTVAIKAKHQLPQRGGFTGSERVGHELSPQRNRLLVAALALGNSSIYLASGGVRKVRPDPVSAVKFL
ncbi:MAG TPA: hypothetical protein VIJ63_06395 [Roseiarcus sp.]